MAGNFIKVTCKDCGSISCSVCGATLTAPSGGNAKLVGCRMVEAME